MRYCLVLSQMQSVSMVVTSRCTGIQLKRGFNTGTVVKYVPTLCRRHTSFNLQSLKRNWHARCLLHLYQTLSTKPEVQRYQVDMSQFPQENIRNFSIIAHIDHGKSTLSDRLLEFTGTIGTDKKNEQVLDKLPVERERGITVKAQTAALFHHHKGTTYLLNLIDTPGHVDFSYEVSRSLVTCQGVVLLVDANQGVQAQTVANFGMALCSNLTIIPVLNKIDLKNADCDAVALQLENVFGINPQDILKVSAKLGTGIDDLLGAIIERIPSPTGNPTQPFRALLFDSWFDHFRGAIIIVRVVDGTVKMGDRITSFATGQTYEIRELGILNPDETPTAQLHAGQVGYIVAFIRSAAEAKVGDTLHHKGETVEPLPTFKPAKPMVFAGIYPSDQSQHTALRNAIERLTLNDSSVTLSFESSPALGQGWRLGFLGLLHMEVFCQRLDQEFDAQVVITAPSVTFKVKIIGAKNIKKYGSDELIITNPLKMPDPVIVSQYYEPMVLGTVIAPERYLGSITNLCLGRRGIRKHAVNMNNTTIMLQYKFPLSEIIVDFFDKLKALSSGYASFDYEDIGYEPTDVVKMSILLNGREVEELTTMVHTSQAQDVGRRMCQKLREVIHPQLFLIAIQAAIGGKIVAREDIRALKKNVVAKLYGGDITRRQKLLKRQAEGKKRMRMIGNVEVPRDAFIQVLKR